MVALLLFGKQVSVKKKKSPLSKECQSLELRHKLYGENNLSVELKLPYSGWFLPLSCFLHSVSGVKRLVDGKKFKTLYKSFGEEKREGRESLQEAKTDQMRQFYRRVIARHDSILIEFFYRQES